MSGKHPIVVRVLRFRCPTCHRGYSSRAKAQKHIDTCQRDPDNRGCLTCNCFQPREKSDYTTGYPGCAEDCDAGCDIAIERKVKCPEWEARP